jgi:hypothetical protein
VTGLPRTAPALVLGLVGCAAAAVVAGGAGSASGAGGAAPHGVNVAVSQARGAQSEASIAIHPLDPEVLVAGSNSEAEPTMRAYGSTDGGRTWTSDAAPPLPPASPPGSTTADPVVGIDRDGRQYYGFVRLGRARAIFVAARPGPASGWTTPAEPISPPPQSGIDDKPALAVDNSPQSPHEGRVYVAWVRRSTFSIRILLSHSDDAAATWSSPVAVNDDDTFVGYPSVAVARDGTVYVAWAGLSRLSLDRSADGGATFGPDRLVAGVRPASRTDCRLLPAQPANCVQHNPVVSVDTSPGPFSGRVYVTYSDPTAKGAFDVLVVAFTPELDRILSPARIHGPDGRRRSDQFWPASAVDPDTGWLWACYYDTRADRTRKRAVFTCTASADGGRTWARPARVASVASNEAQPAANVRGYGDYEGLAAAGGLAHPLWTDSRRLARLQEEIYTATLDGASVVAARS